MTDRIVREAKALYAALEDKEALKRGPIFIEKDGQTEAVLLSIERYQELTGKSDFELWTEQQLAPLRPEIEAYQHLLPELLKEHEGEWVAIHNGKVLEISSNHTEMAHRLMQQGIYPLYIERIQKEPRVADIPHLDFISRD